MMLKTEPLIVLTVLVGCAIAMESFTQTEKFTVKQSGVKKTATCKYKLKFDYPDTVYTNKSSSVSCKVAKWPLNTAISYKKTIKFFIGNFSAAVGIQISKVQNKEKQTTKLLSAIVTTVENKTSPWDLWCPQENTLIWGDSYNPAVVNDSFISPMDSNAYKECARRCSEFENNSGNKPCFSWVLNSNSYALLDLDPGVCRLYAYKDVYRLTIQGVQAGYHKCYPAMQEMGLV